MALLLALLLALAACSKPPPPKPPEPSKPSTAQVEAERKQAESERLAKEQEQKRQEEQAARAKEEAARKADEAKVQSQELPPEFGAPKSPAAAAPAAAAVESRPPAGPAQPATGPLQPAAAAARPAAQAAVPSAPEAAAGGAVPYDQAFPPIPDRVVRIAVVSPPSQGFAGQRVAEMLSGEERERLEHSLGRGVKIAYVSQDEGPGPRTSLIRYRREFFPAAVRVAELVPQAQRILPMSEAQANQMGVDVLVLIGTDLR